MSAGLRTPQLALREGAGRSMTELAERYLAEYLDKIEIAVDGLDDEDLWTRSGAGTNSIANLILHLCGNLSLWIQASLGGRRYDRDRAGEFAADHTAAKSELLDSLRDVVGESRRTIAGLECDALERELEVQGYVTDGRGVVLHAVEHMSYHTGQIVMLAKQALAAEGGIAFYPHHSGE